MAEPNYGMGLRADIRLSQRLVMTPRLQQAILMLQMSRLELQQMIQQEMVENPLLEELSDENPGEETVEGTVDEADGSIQPASASEPPAKEGEDTSSQEALSEFDYQWDDENNFNYEGERESPEEDSTRERTVRQTLSLLEHLMWQLQLSTLTGIEKEIATAIIGNLNDDGYFTLSLSEVAQWIEAPFSQEKAEEVLSVVQGFDPPGVAARDLTECLLIQLAQRDRETAAAETIVKGCLDLLRKKDYQKIAAQTGFPQGEVMEACRLIVSLEPKPSRPFQTTHNVDIAPDLYLTKTANGYGVELNRDSLPSLRVSSFYKKLLRMPSEDNAGARQYLSTKMKSALWLIKSIEQRNETILKVAQSIVKFQVEFLDHGVDHFKRLVLKDVADDISMHPSTVSRVTQGKYLHTHIGIFELKSFFSSGLPPPSSGPGDGAAPVAVREFIRNMVAHEPPEHPLTDQQILEVLGKQGIVIARRTISKYRDLLKIPSARIRRMACANLPEYPAHRLKK
jgi:RNA polymerase sigma-54 factor